MLTVALQDPISRTIEIQATLPHTQRQAWHIAALLLDLSLDYNIISRQLLQNELSIAHEIQPIDKEDLVQSVILNGTTALIEGTIELVWCFQNFRQPYRTRFLVTSTQDSDFDVILGRKSIEEYGLSVRGLRRRRIRWKLHQRTNRTQA
jgi:hypothetical protein